jgi:hypothetical protein
MELWREEDFSATVLLECRCDFELGFQCELRM